MVVLAQRTFGLGGLETSLQLIAAVAGPIVLALVCWGRLPGLLTAAAILVPTPVALATLALRGRRRWPAQEVAALFDDSLHREWLADGIEKIPRNPAEAGTWLAAHPDGTVATYLRANVLLVSGRLEEARAAIAQLPVASARDRRIRTGLELVADAYQGLPIDTTAADAALSADPDLPPAQIAVRLAHNSAVASIDRGGDGQAELAAARSQIGLLSSVVRRRVALLRFRFALISALVGAWVLVSLVVALSTSSGVVWF